MHKFLKSILYWKGQGLNSVHRNSQDDHRRPVVWYLHHCNGKQDGILHVAKYGEILEKEKDKNDPWHPDSC